LGVFLVLERAIHAKYDATRQKNTQKGGQVVRMESEG